MTHATVPNIIDDAAFVNNRLTSAVAEQAPDRVLTLTVSVRRDNRSERRRTLYGRKFIARGNGSPLAPAVALDSGEGSRNRPAPSMRRRPAIAIGKLIDECTTVRRTVNKSRKLPGLRCDARQPVRQSHVGYGRNSAGRSASRRSFGFQAIGVSSARFQTAVSARAGNSARARMRQRIAAQSGVTPCCGAPCGHTWELYAARSYWIQPARRVKITLAPMHWVAQMRRQPARLCAA